MQAAAQHPFLERIVHETAEGIAEKYGRASVEKTADGGSIIKGLDGENAIAEVRVVTPAGEVMSGEYLREETAAADTVSGGNVLSGVNAGSWVVIAEMGGRQFVDYLGTVEEVARQVLAAYEDGRTVRVKRLRAHGTRQERELVNAEQRRIIATVGEIVRERSLR